MTTYCSPKDVGWLGLAGILCGLIICWIVELSASWSLIVTVLAGMMPMLAVTHTHNCLDMTATANTRRVAVRQKLAGTLICLGLWAGTLTLFREFAGSTNNGFWEIVYILWPGLLLLYLFYLFATPRGAIGDLQTLGAIALGDVPRRGRWFSILRIQILKAFFLPLMISAAYAWMVSAQQNSTQIKSDSLTWYLVPLALMYLLDVIFGVIGYLVTSAKFQSHVRSTDSTWSGWAVALICYPPFFLWLTNTNLTRYKDGVEWHHWLGATGFTAHIWGGAILLLTAIYAWATLVFGLRFSNLTNRGIITYGPFRYSKHPAYIAKNLSWWLISIPFISSSGAVVAFQHCAALLVVNFIYFLRAKTEERHLMADQDYKSYAATIASKSVLARLLRRCE